MCVCVCVCVYREGLLKESQERAQSLQEELSHLQAERTELIAKASHENHMHTVPEAYCYWIPYFKNYCFIAENFQ